jgi:predicted sulfurtransferase
MNQEHLGPNALPILNIAGYQFVRLDELDQLRESFYQAASELRLKGILDWHRFKRRIAGRQRNHFVSC